MSTVKSVSGLAVDVLKLEPLCTVNHCPFLSVGQYDETGSVDCAHFFSIRLRFLRSASTGSPALDVPVDSTSRSWI